MRGWWNAVEILFEISNLMKLYNSVVHADTCKMGGAVIFVCEPTNLDEVSNRIPPTSQLNEYVYKDIQNNKYIYIYM